MEMAQSLRVALACPEPRYVDTPFQFRNRTQTSEANSTALRWRGFRQNGVPVLLKPDAVQHICSIGKDHSWVRAPRYWCVTSVAQCCRARGGCRQFPAICPG